jgi:hypothetical protein
MHYVTCPYSRGSLKKSMYFSNQNYFFTFPDHVTCLFPRLTLTVLLCYSPNFVQLDRFLFFLDHVEL